MAAIINFRERMREQPITLTDFRSTADTEDTTAFKRAYDAGHRNILFPAGKGLGISGEFIVSMNHGDTGFSLDSGTILRGQPGTILIPTVKNLAGVIDILSASETDFIDDVLIDDMEIRGFGYVDGFREFSHLIRANGVRRFTVGRGMRLTAFQGDGVYLGSHYIGGLERHNHNVRIYGQYDGINNCNRNAVTVIDCIGGEIDITAKNCTKYGDGTTNSPKTLAQRLNPNYGLGMPGPVDCEPDVRTWHVIQNMDIKVDAEDCGGSAVALLLLPNNYPAQTQKNFKIRVNAKNCTSAFSLKGFSRDDALTTDLPYNVDANILALDCDRSFSVGGVNGLTLSGTAVDCGNAFIAASNSAIVNTNIDVTFIRNASASADIAGKVILIDGSTRDVTFHGSAFIDCGAETPGINDLFFIRKGHHERLGIEKIFSPTMKIAAGVDTRVFARVGGTDIKFTECRFGRNEIGWKPTINNTDMF